MVKRVVQISLLNLYAMAAGGGLALSVVAAYGQTLARLYAAASMAIILTDSGRMDDDVRRALAGLACNVAKSFFLDRLSAGGQVAQNAVNIFAATENLYGTTGGYSPTFCKL